MAFQRTWQYIQPASQPQTTCNHTSPGPPHPASSPPRSSETATQTAAAAIGLHNQRISAQTIRNYHICMLVILIGVSTWLQFVIVTDLSEKMLTFDYIWHFGEVFSSRMNPGFHCTWQMADRVYGVVWVSGLLMSTLWIERPMVAVGLWYEHGMVWGVCYGQRTQVHFINGLLNAQRYRDEILGPIVVPFIHDHHLMLQHDNAWPHVARICTQFLENENIPVLAWPACSPDITPIKHVWDALDRRIRQRVPVPVNIQQLRTAIEEECTNIQQATINNLINSMRRRCVALRKANGGHTRYWLVFGPPPPRTPPIQ